MTIALYKFTFTIPYSCVQVGMQLCHTTWPAGQQFHTLND